MNLKKLLGGTVISLSGEVNDTMVKALDDGLVKAREKKAEPVTIMLSSNGGKVDAGNAIAQRIHLGLRSGLNLNIIGVTHVGSAAVMIFLSLPRERRFVTSDCWIMIHPFRRRMDKSEATVSLKELEERLTEELTHVQHAQSLEATMVRKICRESGLSKEKLESIWRTSHRFNAKNAVEFNLACKIIR